MLKTNYENIKRIASATQKGFWRVQAIAKLDKEIKNGKPQYEYLKSLISLHPRSKRGKSNLELEITPFLQNNNIKQTKETKKLKNIPSFFVTEISPKINYENINGKLFQNENEMMIYNQMPFFFLPIKKIRPRTATEKFYNSRKIEKEFNEKYELIQLYKNSLQYIPNNELSDAYDSNSNISSNSNNKRKNDDILPNIKKNKKINTTGFRNLNKKNSLNREFSSKEHKVVSTDGFTKSNSNVPTISQYQLSGLHDFKK